MFRPGFRAAYLALFLVAVACTPGETGTSQANGNDPEATRHAIAARLPIQMADGGTSRMVRENGLVAMLSMADSAMVLLWPGSVPILGAGAIYTAVMAVRASQPEEFFWQPMMLRFGDGLGLVAGVLVVRGGMSQTGNLELGRYLAVWRLAPEASKLLAFMPAQVGLASLPDSAVAPMASPAPLMLPIGMAQADSAFRNRLRTDGPSTAFGAWYAENGLSFGNGGIVDVGPEAIAQRLAGSGVTSRWEMTPHSGGAAADTSLAWVAGDLLITQDASATQHWNYMIFWERQLNGEFRIIAVLTNLGPRQVPTS